MKIAFFTEGSWTGRVSRDNPNMRTEMAWMCALQADHYNIHGGSIQGEYDLAVCIIPKKNPQFDVSRIRAHCKRCLLYTSPSPRDGLLSRMPSSA